MKNIFVFLTLLLTQYSAFANDNNCNRYLNLCINDLVVNKRGSVVRIVAFDPKNLRTAAQIVKRNYRENYPKNFLVKFDASELYKGEGCIGDFCVGDEVVYFGSTVGNVGVVLAINPNEKNQVAVLLLAGKITSIEDYARSSISGLVYIVPVSSLMHRPSLALIND